MSIGNAREAIEFAGRKYQVERILLSGELRTAAGDLFLSKYGELINLNRSGQLAMARLLKDGLRRITYDELNLPIRLSVSSTDDDAIVMDPWMAFGRPIIFGRGISTAAIVDRVDAGETIDDIAQDYKLTTEQVEAAIGVRPSGLTVVFFTDRDLGALFPRVLSGVRLFCVDRFRPCS